MPIGCQFVLKCSLALSRKQKLHLDDLHKIQASVFESCRGGSEYWYWDKDGIGHVSLICSAIRILRIDFAVLSKKYT